MLSYGWPDKFPLSNYKLLQLMKKRKRIHNRSCREMGVLDSQINHFNNMRNQARLVGHYSREVSFLDDIIEEVLRQDKAWKFEQMYSQEAGVPIRDGITRPELRPFAYREKDWEFTFQPGMVAQRFEELQNEIFHGLNDTELSAILLILKDSGSFYEGNYTMVELNEQGHWGLFAPTYWP